MSIKNDMIEQLNNLQSIILDSKLVDNSNIKTIEKLTDNINDFKIYLPLIGNFNAGKSSILNALLEDAELLATDIIPETAIATEIIYSTNERVEAYDFKSNKPLATFDNLDSLKDKNIEDYGYLKVYKNIPFLERNRDIIFVDMPGLDSNIDRHNHQILNYLQKDAISFISVIDVDDGTLKDSTLRFIEEINSYKLDFFLIINKIDKKPPSDVKKIQDNIKNQLLKYSTNPYVGAISTFDEDINDFKNIITKVDKDKYIKATLLNKITLQIDEIHQDLTIRKNAMTLDTSEIDNKITEFQDGIYQFDKSLRKEKQRLENQFSSNTTTDILNRVKEALEVNLDRLIQSIETSQDNFKSTVSEIIRPVIVQAINKHTEKEFSIVMDNLETSSENIFDNISDLIEKSNSALNVLDTLIKSSPLLLKIPVLANLLKIISTKIHPAIAVISTLVSIVSTFFWKSKEEQEKVAKEKMKENIKSNVIPQIVMQLQPTITNALTEIQNNFFKEIEKSINEQKENLIDSLNQAKEEKKKYKNEIKTKVEDFEKIIEELNTCHNEVIKL